MHHVMFANTLGNQTTPLLDEHTETSFFCFKNCKTKTFPILGYFISQDGSNQIAKRFQIVYFEILIINFPMLYGGLMVCRGGTSFLKRALVLVPLHWVVL